MKDHHKDKAHSEHKTQKVHPHHKGAGMPYFEKEHWQKNVADIKVADERYSSEMNQQEEYKKSVDGLAEYAKRHREKH